MPTNCRIAAAGVLLLAGAVWADSPPVPAAERPVPYVRPKPIWDRFTILVWQYKTDVRRDLDLYRQIGLRGFHVDRGAGAAAVVDFARAHGLPYYVDHAADKGYLHLTDRTGLKELGRFKGRLAPRPWSLAEPGTREVLEGHLRKNIAVTKSGPVLAYAFDDEISLGSFNTPIEVDASSRSVAGYRRWLAGRYGSIAALNRSWAARLGSFDEAQPAGFEALRARNSRPPLARWNLAAWMDWRSYMDTQFASFLAGLARFANSLDAATPAGFVGGQQPAPYGGFDYAKLCRSVQWMESYDIGGTCEILRSLWSWPERRPYVQTWFSTGSARRDAWFLWYYLLHGNRGVIAWPDKGGSWFRRADGGVAPFIAENAATIREVQSEVSEAILDPDARFDADPIAVYYSHPSVQAAWAMDVVTHGKTWPNRSSSLDDRCQSAGKNRVAWFKLLEDCGFQYDVVTAQQVAGGRLARGAYKVLIVNRVAAMSDAEADAVRAFVRGGGTVIADHLTGVLDEHGRGRSRGVLDDLFGIERDESAGYLDGRGVTEIDGERYREPFLQRLRYDGALRHGRIVVYERGTRAAAGATAAARVGGADVAITRRVGSGRAVYLNLTNLGYYDHAERVGAFGEQWRRLLSAELARSGLLPRARVLSGGEPVPMAELVYWRKGGRVVIGLVKNPARQGSVSGAGDIGGVTGGPIDVQIVFRDDPGDVVDLRTGAKLPPGKVIRARWKPWEALLYRAGPAK